MRSDVTTRRIPFLTIICTLLLMIGVVAWGAKYKMSLYDPPGSASLSMPHAKLLSQKERPVTSTHVQPASPPSPQPESLILAPSLLLAGLLLALSTSILFRAWISKEERQPEQRFADLTFFAFRPPPALHLS
jgi:hypothetical protein